MRIGLSNNVNLIAHTLADGTGFNAASKHLQGINFYGVDSDITAQYQSRSTAGPGAMDEGVCPEVTADDDFDGETPDGGSAWALM